jgi:hypothetical protein
MDRPFSKRRHLSAPWLVALDTLDLAPLSRPETSQSSEDSGSAAQSVQLAHTLQSASARLGKPFRAPRRTGANACESGSRIPFLIVELESILHSVRVEERLCKTASPRRCRKSVVERRRIKDAL